MICGESMTLNSVLRCIVMYCLTGGGHDFVAIVEWVHMEWSGCIIGNKGEAG